MAAVRVRYKGLADRRVIRPSEIAPHGINLDKDLVWDRYNGFALDIDADDKMVKLLREQGHFSVSALTDEGATGELISAAETPENPGDTVMIPPNVLHWHGAAPDRLFAHLAMSENSDTGAGTAWGEHVSDAEYTAAVA